jgi:hypothetical protein
MLKNGKYSEIFAKQSKEENWINKGYQHLTNKGELKSFEIRNWTYILPPL